MDVLKSEITELLAALRSGELTAVALMEATLERVHAVNPAINAIVSLRSRETLLREASDADLRRRKGAALGSLHGLPMAIKDLSAVKGFATTMGSPLFAGQIAAKDDPFVHNLRAAGAIFIGKTNTPEFGLGSHTFNPVYGATRNPYDPALSVGGSSGGAAAALAMRMVHLADGSDMMGSLRNPASWNNVYGLRPSVGTLPGRFDGDQFLHPLSTNGPMARSPEGLAILCDAMRGAVRGHPKTISPVSLVDAMKPTFQRPRLAWLGDWGGAFPMDPGLMPLMERALGDMRKLGWRIADIAPPMDIEPIWDAWTVLRSWAVAAAQKPLFLNKDTRAQLKPEAVWEIERGLRFSGQEIQNASTARSEWYRAAGGLFDSYDALIMPSTQTWPFPIDDRWPKTIAGRQMRSYHEWMASMVPVSLLGLPSVNIPIGFGNEGLPAGVQIFTRHGEDSKILRLARDWHHEYDWPGEMPPKG